MKTIVTLKPFLIATILLVGQTVNLNAQTGSKKTVSRGKSCVFHILTDIASVVSAALVLGTSFAVGDAIGGRSGAALLAIPGLIGAITIRYKTPEWTDKNMLGIKKGDPHLTI